MSSNKVLSQAQVQNTILTVAMGDITREPSEVIVNAANSFLAHGAGVAGAIMDRGGYEIQQESSKWVRENGEVMPGHVAVTGAGRMRYKAIVHAVGPYWRGGRNQERETLASAIWNSLAAAQNIGAESISIPAISSGIFGFPKDECAKVLTETAIEFCNQNPETCLKEIRFTNYDYPTVSFFEDAFMLNPVLSGRQQSKEVAQQVQEVEQEPQEEVMTPPNDDTIETD